MEISIAHFLIVAAILFAIGVAGVLTRRNAIIILMSAELMLNAANLTFIAFARHHGDPTGHLFVFMVICVAAAEAAVGLALVLAIFRRKKSINVDELSALRG